MISWLLLHEIRRKQNANSPRVIKPGSILARLERVLTTSPLFIYSCRHRSIRFCTCRKLQWQHVILLADKFNTSGICLDYDKEIIKGHLTSSISSRETFLLSLLARDIEPASASGVSVPLLFWWLSCDPCETWEDNCGSAVVWGSCRHPNLS